MSAAQSEKRFKELLRELFQFSRADLNFGIYRVMNQKREQMEHFIENDIVAAVNEALQDDATAHIAATDKEEISSWLKSTLGGDVAFDSRGKLKAGFEGSPMGKAWKALQGGDAVPLGGEEERRKEVFNALYTFFSRYYDDGDFMCKQRYAAHGRYAVPYNGEEVLLHWANKDQYYIKTAEYFPRYEYKPAAGTAAVRFEIQTAELEQDNNKSGEKKYFLPLADKVQAPTKRDNAHILPFAYRPLTAVEREIYPSSTQSTNQDAIIQAALNALRAAPFAATEKSAAQLEEHLNRYIRRNTADFFIHKNLRRFLRGELDYYLNKELLNAEELLRNNANTRARFSVANALRAAADKTIDFLAQLEDYQKLIWEKKKFITETHYAIRLSTISDDGLLDAVAANNAQWREWEQLGFIPADARCRGKAQRRAFMKKHPTLTVDTAHFSDAFKMQWLETVEHLDCATDGVLFHSENWQALNLMQEKYRGKVQCVYIDPPYNTASSEILYKNDYKHSSWLSLIENRVRFSKFMLTENGTMSVAIDHCELLNLGVCLDSLFGKDNRLAIIAVIHKAEGRQFAKGVNPTNDYMLWYGENAMLSNVPRDEEKREVYNEEEQVATGEVRRFCWIDYIRKGGGDISLRKNNPDNWFPVYVSPDLTSFSLECKKGWEVVYPVTNGGQERTWNTSAKTFEQNIKDGEIKAERQEGRIKILRKLYAFQSIKTHWDSAKYNATRYGTGELKKLALADAFSYPKSIYAVLDTLKITTIPESTTLDYFAGSGTTAHAVINLNREDDGRRKFILAEMGEYFNTVLLPRIKKVIFSPQWEEGKPARYATEEEINRAPRIIKYHCIESYDDALENIRFNDSIGEAMGLFDDYVPRYMLQAESAACASLAGDSAAFKRPFCYTLKKANDNGTAAVADLPETFAYLIGLQEKTRRTVCNGKKKYIIQSGIADNRKTMVIWRDTENWENADYEKERDFIAKQKLTADAERVYVNDDSLIPRAESLTPVITKKMFSSYDE